MKRNVALLLIFALCFTLFLLPVNADIVTLRGNIDYEGGVTAADARTVLRMAVELDDKPETWTYDFLVADVDNDGKITAADARLILRAAVGLEMISDHPYLPLTVLDEKGVRILLTHIEQDFAGTYFDFTVENRTDHTVDVLVGEPSVNGYLPDASDLELPVVAPHETAEGSLLLADHWLDEYTFLPGRIDSLGFFLQVYDLDDVDGGIPRTLYDGRKTVKVPGTVVIDMPDEYPYFEYLWETDEAGFRFVVMNSYVDLDADSRVTALHLNLACKNKGDKPLLFSVGNVRIDGASVGTLWARTVYPGTFTKSNFTVTDYDLFLAGLDPNGVDEMTFTLEVLDPVTMVTVFSRDYTVSYKVWIPEAEG